MILESSPRLRRAYPFVALGTASLLMAGCAATVLPSKPHITWETPAAITYGTPLSATQLDATDPEEGKFSYYPSLGTVLHAGSQTLSVTFTPADTTEYSTATASVALTVNQKTSTLSWANPNAIAGGVPLSATQLDATASVPGVFAYNPGLGAVLPVGTQTLSVTFTPNDATDYTTASGTATISVEGIVVFGDSLTCGGQGNAYGQSPIGSVPSTLQSLLGVTSVNQGVGGDTSSQIAVRANAGGSNQVVTLSGSQTSASGSVQVTFPIGWEPVTADGGNNGAGCYQSPSGIGTNATVNGVAGTFLYSGDNYYFNPVTSLGPAASTRTIYPYTVATPYDGYFFIDSSGTNDFHNGASAPTTSIANDKAMTALAGSLYIVTSALPFIYSSYWTRGSDADALANLNAAKALTFGDHYVDTLTPLLDGCQPLPGTTIAALDAIDIGHGIVPTSCRSYDAAQLDTNISPGDTSLCLNVSYISDGMVGYLSHTAAPEGNVEAILIAAVSTPGRCSTGSEVTVVRGFAGTIAGNYRANIDSWGYWSDVHLTGGTPNNSLAAKTGYSIQAEAIAAAYERLTGGVAP